MKKISVLLAALALFTTVLLSQNLYAAELSVGATTWYSWWDFNALGNGKDQTVNPSFLYGPALSAKFNDDFNMTFVFLYGKFEMGEDPYSNKVSRIDSDLALNYRLNSAFKLFAGIKYMSFFFSDFSHRGVGPGLGVSGVVPLTGNFYMLGNISSLYQRGKEENKEFSSDYNEFGGNAGISLAYYIAPASTTISLGGRYQIFRTFYDGTDENNDFNDTIHQFYGVTLSATYSFSL